MAKKLLSTLVVVSLMLTLVCAFASCGDENVSTTVTAEEWKAAFDLSKYESFVLTVDEYLKEFESEWTTKGTIKVDDGVIYNDYVSTKDGEKEKHTDSYKGKISSLMDLLDISAGYIEYFFSENDDYGYAMCKYKEDSKSYYVEIDMDGTPCDVNIWFENGKIVKITCVGQDDAQKCDFTYSFAF